MCGECVCGLSVCVCVCVVVCLCVSVCGVCVLYVLSVWCELLECG